MDQRTTRVKAYDRAVDSAGDGEGLEGGVLLEGVDVYRPWPGAKEQ